jgi:hypothetical protein
MNFFTTLDFRLSESTYKFLSFSSRALRLAYEDMWRTGGEFPPNRHALYIANNDSRRQYINNMGVYRQTQLYSLLMLLCYMFRPITVAIFRLIDGGGFFYIQFFSQREWTTQI